MNRLTAIFFQIFLLGLNLFSAFYVFMTIFCGMVGTPEQVTSACRIAGEVILPFLALEAVVGLVLARNMWRVFRSDPRAFGLKGLALLVFIMLFPIMSLLTIDAVF